jgi:hypothetical protein
MKVPSIVQLAPSASMQLSVAAVDSTPHRDQSTTPNREGP